jgi:endonuclease YncB( thermonuclease family)
MKQLHLILFFLSFSFLIFASGSWAGQFKVTRVCDGDTIKAKGHDIEIMVRLVGIDAPEISHRKGQPSQPYSQKSKKYLSSLILNKTVGVKGYGLDRYHRILGVIYLEGKNINLEMIRVGLAEVYRGKPPHGLDMEPFQKAEIQAEQAKNGFWSLGDKYVSPREWRKAQRQK